MPTIIFGTTGFRSYDIMKQAVDAALDAGCRAFDTSRFYTTGRRRTEWCLGRILQRRFREGKEQRSEVYITTKLSIPQLVRGEIERDIKKSLRDLRTQYIDCLLIHWPFEDFYIEGYRKMEKLCADGLVKSIGLSNCSVRHLGRLFDAGIEVVPAVHQIERHPLHLAQDMVDYCREVGISIQVYSPLAKMIPELSNSEILSLLAQKYHKTMAQIILRWHVHENTAPIFRSKTPNRILENLRIFDFDLDRSDIDAIRGMNRDYKLCTESVRCPGY